MARTNQTARGASIMLLLATAPAFASDVAVELRMPEGQARKCLRRLHLNKKIVRRPWHHDTIKETWLYLLPEHQLLKDK